MSSAVQLTLAQARVLLWASRLRMLRALEARPLTATELSRAVGLGRSTTHEHLHRLVRAGFVRREEKERLWVRYSLTSVGLHVARSDPLHLVLPGVLAACAALLLALALRRRAREDADAWDIEPIGVPAEPVLPEVLPLVIALLALALAWWSWRARRQLG